MSENIPLSIPEIRGNEWRYVKECLDTGWVSSGGKYVGEFESKVASVLGSKYAVACVNGTAALHISLILAGVGPGDEVIAPAVTFIAPLNAIRYTGAEPVFMDCDDYLNIDAEKIGEFIKKKCGYKNGKLVNQVTGKVIRAILPVHVFGHPVDLAPIMELAAKYELRVIEDATESIGSHYRKGKYKGKKTGSVGDLGCLSFNGNKLLTAGGGGMIITDDRKMAEKAKYLTSQAKNDEVKYVHDEIGYNYRLTNVASAIGVAQLEKIEEYIAIKRSNFKKYRSALKNVEGLRMITEPDYGFSNYWFYSLVADQKIYGRSNLDLLNILAERKIEARPLWKLNHKQKPYRKYLAYKIEKADKYYDQVLSLPCSVSLKEKDIRKVVRAIKDNAKK